MLLFLVQAHYTAETVVDYLPLSGPAGLLSDTQTGEVRDPRYIEDGTSEPHTDSDADVASSAHVDHNQELPADLRYEDEDEHDAVAATPPPLGHETNPMTVLDFDMVVDTDPERKWL